MTQLAATLVMIFAPLGRLARLWRALIAYIDGLGAILADDTLAHELDDPHVRAFAERYIAMAEDGIAILITQRTRELLGLPFQRIETRQPAHLPHPPSRKHLLARHARMLALLGSIERAAQRRAARIRREQSPLRLAPSAQSSTLCVDPASLRLVEANHRASFNVQIASLSAQHWGRWHARTCAHDGGGAHARGPPSSPRLSIIQTQLPQKPASETAPA
jgi:hypothetical protein